MHLPDFFAVHFDDPHFELFDKNTFTIGTRVEIAFRAEGDPVVVTSGEVTAIAVEPGASGRHELVLTGFDLTHRLAREPKSRSFQRVTDADIATRIAGEYGLDADVDATGAAHDYVLQAGETDYAFLRRRAARIGYDVWISEKTFYFKRDAAARRPPRRSCTYGQNLSRVHRPVLRGRTLRRGGDPRLGPARQGGHPGPRRPRPTRAPTPRPRRRWPTPRGARSGGSSATPASSR